MLFLLAGLPAARASAPDASSYGPAGRWGHQAVFVESQNAMYVVGGEVSGSGTQITNDVLILDLSESNPGWAVGPNRGLPAHAFASMALSVDGSRIAVLGGMASSCTMDSIVHSLDLASGTSMWTNVQPDRLIRRHGAAAVGIPGGPSEMGQVMLVGGLADGNSCAAGSSAYAAADTLSVPIDHGSLTSTRALPTSLTGDQQAVSDFALAKAPDNKLFIAGGRAADGSLISHEHIGVWTSDGGWTTQEVTGDIPAGRLGASLVAHPTLDLLILHGGSEVHGQSYAPSSLVSFLNTTSWEWNKPGHLQPPASSAVAYHTAVMTKSGVMITAFGMPTTGRPSANTYFLDMRDPSASTWSWKAVWSKEMAESFGTADSGAGKSNSTTIAAAVVPTVIVLLLLVGVAVFFIRRRRRQSRKRRLASHFSFEAQEDNGEFDDKYQPVSQTNYPFSGHDNGGGSYLTNIASSVAGVFRTTSNTDRDVPHHGIGDDGTINEREMAAIAPAQLNEKGKWEDIDFGLGRVDAERREGQYTDLPRRSPRSSPRSSIARLSSSSAGSISRAAEVPLPDDSDDGHGPHHRRGSDSSARVGTPQTDGQMPLVATSPPASQQALASAVHPDHDDWNMLEQTLQSRPAFRAISPNATLRSHHHHRHSSGSPPSPFDDQYAEPESADTSFGDTSFGSTASESDELQQQLLIDPYGYNKPRRSNTMRAKLGSAAPPMHVRASSRSVSGPSVSGMAPLPMSGLPMTGLPAPAPLGFPAPAAVAPRPAPGTRQLVGSGNYAHLVEAVKQEHQISAQARARRQSINALGLVSGSNRSSTQSRLRVVNGDEGTQ